MGMGVVGWGEVGLVAFVFGHCAYIASFGFGSKLHYC